MANLPRYRQERPLERAARSRVPRDAPSAAKRPPTADARLMPEAFAGHNQGDGSSGLDPSRSKPSFLNDAGALQREGSLRGIAVALNRQAFPHEILLPVSFDPRSPLFRPALVVQVTRESASSVHPRLSQECARLSRSNDKRADGPNNRTWSRCAPKPKGLDVAHPGTGTEGKRRTRRASMEHVLVEST